MQNSTFINFYTPQLHESLSADVKLVRSKCKCLFEPDYDKLPLETLNKLYELRSSLSVTAICRLAMIFSKQKMFDKAHVLTNEFNYTTDLFTVRSYLDFAYVYLASGDEEKACTVIEECYNKFENQQDLYARLAWQYFWPLKQYDKVIEWFRNDYEAVRLSSGQMINYAIAYSVVGELELALNIINETYLIDVKCMDGYSRVALHCYLSEQNYKDIVKLFERDVELSRFSGKLTSELAFAYAAINKISDAMASDSSRTIIEYSNIAWTYYWSRLSLEEAWKITLSENLTLTEKCFIVRLFNMHGSANECYNILNDNIFEELHEMPDITKYEVLIIGNEMFTYDVSFLKRCLDKFQGKIDMAELKELYILSMCRVNKLRGHKMFDLCSLEEKCKIIVESVNLSDSDTALELLMLLGDVPITISYNYVFGRLLSLNGNDEQLAKFYDGQIKHGMCSEAMKVVYCAIFTRRFDISLKLVDSYLLRSNLSDSEYTALLQEHIFLNIHLGRIEQALLSLDSFMNKGSGWLYKVTSLHLLLFLGKYNELDNLISQYLSSRDYHLRIWASLFYDLDSDTTGDDGQLNKYSVYLNQLPCYSTYYSWYTFYLCQLLIKAKNFKMLKSVINRYINRFSLFKSVDRETLRNSVVTIKDSSDAIVVLKEICKNTSTRLNMSSELISPLLFRDIICI